MKKNFLKKPVFSLLFFLLAALVLTGCSNRNKTEKNTFTIAEQFGIAYAPLNIMKEMGYLEERLPGIDIEWKQFGGPTAIREGMLNGEIDFGFMGISPVLIGIDNGMEWKYATGISSNQVAIVTDRPELTSLADFTSEDKIAILSPGCTQHVILCMLAEKEFSDPRCLDNQTVSMTHPDAMNALISDTEVAAHVATPPYIQEELSHGMHIIADGEELMGGPFTFISGVSMISFYENHRDWYNAFIDALEESVDYINSHKKEAAALLAPVYGITEEELLEQMNYNGTIYSTQLTGVEKMSEAMARMGFIKKAPAFEDIIFDNVNQ